MAISTVKKLVGGAAAAASVGLLIVPAPSAQADYDCYEQGGYQFPGGQVVIHYPETDAETRFRVVKGEAHVDTAAETFYQNGTSLPGRITGDIEKGGNIIRLEVTRGSKYPPLVLDGAIGPDGTPQGSFVTGSLDRQNWDSPTQFACIPGPPVEDRPAPAPAPAPAPEPVAAEQPAPAPQEAPAPAPEEAAAPAPEEAAAPAPEPNQPCIPDPFDLNFPGAC